MYREKTKIYDDGSYIMAEFERETQFASSHTVIRVFFVDADGDKHSVSEIGYADRFGAEPFWEIGFWSQSKTRDPKAIFDAIRITESLFDLARTWVRIQIEFERDGKDAYTHYFFANNYLEAAQIVEKEIEFFISQGRDRIDFGYARELIEHLKILSAV